MKKHALKFEQDKLRQENQDRIIELLKRHDLATVNKF